MGVRVPLPAPLKTMTKVMARTAHIYFSIFALALLLLFVADLYFGSVSFSFDELFNTEAGRDLLLKFRLPKAVAACVAGVALSVCGLQMQTLFRNPLADPYILGVSSGSGLGVAVYLMGISVFGGAAASSVVFSLGTAGAAFIGAAVVTLLVLHVSNHVRSAISLLIFGVMIGFVASALVTLLQYLSNAHTLKAYVLWTMGSFAGLNNIQLWILSALVLLGLALSVMNMKALNSLLLGDDQILSLGLSVKAIRRRVLLASTILAGAVTAFCGPIGFLGIAVPHIARFIFKEANHRILMPASALMGGCLTLGADIIAQLPGSGSVLPINTVAALLGIPVILVILLQKN